MTDLTELFARDPHGLSDQDIDAIIEGLRGKRKHFNTAQVPASKKTTAKKPKPSLLTPDEEVEL